MENYLRNRTLSTLNCFQSQPHKVESVHKHSFGFSQRQSQINSISPLPTFRRVGKARPGEANVSAGSCCGSLGCRLPELVLGLSAARLTSTHTLCASGRGGRVASVCTGPGGAGSVGTAAGRGRAGLTGGSWPPPGAALLGPGRAAPERKN